MDKDIRKLITKMKASKKIIAKERDKLRELLSEVEGIVESLDVGVDDIESGFHYLETGIDSLSEYL